MTTIRGGKGNKKMKNFAERKKETKNKTNTVYYTLYLQRLNE